MKELLLVIKKTVDDTRLYASGLDYRQTSSFESRYLEIIQLGQKENPASTGKTGKRSPRGQSKAKNLLDRCRIHMKEILGFMHDFNVPNQPLS